MRLRLAELNKAGDLRGKKRHISPRAKQAVGLILSGEAKSLKSAVVKAGYAPSTAANPGRAVFMRKTVVDYLMKLDKESRKKFGLSIQDKVMKTFFDGLEATKLYGKKAKKHPDYHVRLEYADRFARFFNWVEEGFENPNAKFSQFNFFNVDSEKQKEFGDNLKNMIRKSYPPTEGGVPVDTK